MLDYCALFQKYKVMFTPGSSVVYPHHVDLDTDTYVTLHFDVDPDPAPYRPKPSTVF
jgi:hypothetical protein